MKNINGFIIILQKDIVEGVKLHAEKIKKNLSIVQKKEPYFIRAQNHNQDIEKHILMLEKNKKIFWKY